MTDRSRDDQSFPNATHHFFSQMKITLVIAMWNAMVVASLKQNNFSLLD